MNRKPTPPAVVSDWIKQMHDKSSPLTSRMMYESYLEDLVSHIEENLTRFRADALVNKRRK